MFLDGVLLRCATEIRIPPVGVTVQYEEIRRVVFNLSIRVKTLLEVRCMEFQHKDKDIDAYQRDRK